MRVISLLALFAVSTLIPLYGKDCSNISTLGGAVTLENTKNQGDIGWCYAYAAADMLSQYYNIEISPRDTANSYNNSLAFSIYQPLFNLKEYTIDGGYLRTALRLSSKKGNCEYNSLPDETKGHVTKRLKELDSIRNHLKTIFKSDARLSDVIKYISNKTLITPELQSYFPKLNIEDFAVALMSKKNDTYYEKLIDMSCSNERIYPYEKLKLKTHTNYLHLKNTRFISYIDKYLSMGKIVGISYYASIITNPTGKLKGGHVSSIVARRFNEDSKKCEYLIRNSWGKKCTSYAKNLSCENGHIWVPEDSIKRGVTDITIIKN